MARYATLLGLTIGVVVRVELREARQRQDFPGVRIHDHDGTSAASKVRAAACSSCSAVYWMPWSMVRYTLWPANARSSSMPSENNKRPERSRRPLQLLGVALQVVVERVFEAVFALASGATKPSIGPASSRRG